MSRSGGHWSRPAAWRALCALMQHGGSATTWQIAQITRSTAVHQEIYSLRCWLQFCCGYDEDDTHEAVRTEREGANENGRQVIRYYLREDVRQLHRRLRQTPAPQNGYRQKCIEPEPEVQTDGSGQAVLFDTESRAARRRAAE